MKPKTKSSTIALTFSATLAIATLGCSSSDTDGPDPGAGNPGTGGPLPPTEPEIDPRNGYPRCPSDPALMTGEPCSDSFGAVLCGVETGYPGDELALCHRPDEALLLHYGPDPAHYDDPAALEPFLLGPGMEDENCMFVISENPSEAFLTNYHGRMRPQSHHLIVTTITGTPAVSPLPVACRQTEVVGSRWLAGSQDPQIDVSVGGAGASDDNDVPQPGDPDYGLATRIDASTPVRLDMHYINPTDEPILREAWLTFDYVDQADVVNLVDMITFYQGDISVPPYSTSVTEAASCVAATDRYVGLLTGHFHENGLRFSVWKQDRAGARTVVYETYDWADPGNLFYRDGIENPTPNPTAGTHGGDSGYLHLLAGESLVYQCEFENPTNVTVTLGDTASDQMCNVFGMYYPTDGNVWSCACLGAGCF